MAKQIRMAWIAEISTDVRFGWRMLQRSPGFALATIRLRRHQETSSTGVTKAARSTT